MIVELSALDDSRLDDFIRLTDVALRKKLESERGLYLAEGLKVITRSLEVGHTPRAILSAPRWVAEITDLLVKANVDAPIFVTDEMQIKEITGYKIHRGAMAAMNRPPLLDLDDFFSKLSVRNPGQQRIFILEDLVDHTNVGAIFRSAAALGIDGILITPSCADPLYRRAIKVAMGNVFHIPWTRIPNWPQSMIQLAEQGWITASLALDEHALSLTEFAQLPEVSAPNSKVAIVLGTEGDGLRKRTIAHTSYKVIIPMQENVDSLNVAAAGAVAAWELRAKN